MKIRPNVLRVSLALCLVAFSGVQQEAEASRGFLAWLLAGDEGAARDTGGLGVRRSRDRSRILLIGEHDADLVRALESVGHWVQSVPRLEDVRTSRYRYRYVLVDAEFDLEAVNVTEYFAKRLDAPADVRPGLTPMFVRHVWHKKRSPHETVAMMESYFLDREEDMRLQSLEDMRLLRLRRLEETRRRATRTETHYEESGKNTRVEVPRIVSDTSRKRGRANDAHRVLLPAALGALGWLLALFALRRRPLLAGYKTALEAWSVPQVVAIAALFLAALVSPAFGLLSGVAFAAAHATRGD